MFRIVAALALLCIAAEPATALRVDLLLSARSGHMAASDAVLVSHPSFDGFLSGSSAVERSLGIVVPPSDVITGLVHDGAYHLLTTREQSDLFPGTSDTFLYSYPTFDDMIANTNAVIRLLGLRASSAFPAAGLAYDGAYHLVMAGESALLPGNNAEFLFSYNTFDDMIANTNVVARSLSPRVSSLYSLEGLAYNGSYHMLFAGGGDLTPGNDALLLSYPTFGDMISNTNAFSLFLNAGVPANYALAGLSVTAAGSPDFGDPPIESAVPAPAAGALLLGALGALATLRRRRRP